MGHRRRKTNTHAAQNKQSQTLPRLLAYLQIKEWDYLVVGDGSATDWHNQCGWASVLIENGTLKRELYYGCFNRGSNIVGELMAPMQALMHLAIRDDRRIGEDGATFVHVVTDCEYVKKAGNREQNRKKYRAIWNTFDHYRRMGLLVEFHWVPRDSIPLQHFTHHAANGIRRASKATHRARMTEAFGALQVSHLGDLNSDTALRRKRSGRAQRGPPERGER